MLDSSQLLGFRLCAGRAHPHNPYISAKIGFSDPTVDVTPVESAVAAGGLDMVSHNNMILNIVDSRTNGMSDDAPLVFYFLPPTKQSNVTTLGKNMWASATYSNGDVATVDTAKGYDYDSYRLTLGSDLYDDEASRLLVGAFVSYTHSDIETKASAGTASAMNYYQLGGYGNKKWGEAFNLTFAGSIGYADLENTRGTLATIAEGETDGFGYSVGAELSHDAPWLRVSHVALSPFVRLQASSLDLSSYNETGGGGLALHVASAKTHQLFSTIGVDIRGTNNTADTMGFPDIKIGWARELLDDEAVAQSSLISTPTTSYTTSSPDTENDYLSTAASYSLKLNDTMQLSADYAGLYNSDVKNNTFGVGFQYQW